MLPRNLNQSTGHQLFHAQELADGIPTVAGLAWLCSRSLGGISEATASGLSVDDLPPAARTILHSARDRGMIEIRSQSESFDSSMRLTAVAVEQNGDRRVVFRKASDPAWTMRFIEGFRWMCENGLVLHQHGREFVLSHAGFQLARSLAKSVEPDIELAITEDV